MEIRGYREGDLGAMARLAATAFGFGVEGAERYFDPEKNPRLDVDLVYVVEEDGEARAGATVLPLEVFVDGHAVPMGGIAAVMTHPAYRRRGYAGDLMRAVLAAMRERGVHLSVLWPFAHAFYRAFGWELAAEAIAYTLKPTDLPTSPEQKRVRARRDGDLPRMMELFDREAAGHQICVRRTEDHWRRGPRVGEERETAVYERDGKVEGYLAYGISGWKEGRTPPRTMNVQELVATDKGAWEALVSFLAAQDPLVFEIKLFTPQRRPLHPYLASSYVDAKVEPDFMLRLVDVRGALGLLRRSTPEPLTLEVTDDVIPENTGLYTLGDGEVVVGAEAGETVALDVRRLAQLYAGYLSAEDLHRNGCVRPSSPRALELLSASFPPADPWISSPDHF